MLPEDVFGFINVAFYYYYYFLRRDENINNIEKECREQIQAYVRCVDNNPDTWQTVCQSEKRKLNQCSSAK